MAVEPSPSLAPESRIILITNTGINIYGIVVMLCMVALLMALGVFLVEALLPHYHK